jgi:UDP-4-amino-4,6-dideoxy-N-acetyl-beta-L-altrosamine transaminase
MSSRLPYSTQWITSKEVRAVHAVLCSPWLTQGPKVAEFEQKLAARVGARYAVALANGTAALHLTAIALGLRPQHEVITTPISFLATSNAVLYTGAKPVFADIEEDTGCLDPNAVEQKITKKTKAIFLTHFAGHPVDVSAIARIANKHRLAVVEDAAHALGTEYKGTPIGNARYSNAAAAIFSFHPVKHITTGEGGAVTTDDPNLYQQLLDLRSHGMVREPGRLKRKDQGSWYYEMQSLGFNYRLTELQAALGIVQLDRLDFFLKRRREIAAHYDEAFKKVEEMRVPAVRDYALHAYHLYPIRLCLNRLTASRKKLFEQLQHNGLGVQVHYIPIPMQPYYRRLGYHMRDLPHARAYYEQTISIPLYPKMNGRDVWKVIRTVKDVLRMHSKTR